MNNDHRCPEMDEAIKEVLLDALTQPTPPKKVTRGKMGDLMERSQLISVFNAFSAAAKLDVPPKQLKVLYVFDSCRIGIFFYPYNSIDAVHLEWIGDKFPVTPGPALKNFVSRESFASLEDFYNAYLREYKE